MIFLKLFSVIPVSPKLLADSQNVRVKGGLLDSMFACGASFKKEVAAECDTAHSAQDVFSKLEPTRCS